MLNSHDEPHARIEALRPRAWPPPPPPAGGGGPRGGGGGGGEGREGEMKRGAQPPSEDPLVPNIVVVGAQWGDEGKGKVVDLVAPCVDIVARYSGGPNAGHTVVVGDRRYVMQSCPSGVLRPGKRSVIGCGVVVDPEALPHEMGGVR